MKTKLANTLPKTSGLSGAVCAQWRRCGKKNCHCRTGKPHGPYYYVFWRENSILRKRYIRCADVEPMRQAYESDREQQARLRHDREASRQLWQTMRQLLRDLKGAA